MMGVAAAFAWPGRGTRAGRVGFALFGLQLALNALWSWIFFHWHRLDLAFVELTVLWVTILGTIIAFRRIRPLAGFLLLPYLAWVTFAGVLNFYDRPAESGGRADRAGGPPGRCRRRGLRPVGRRRHIHLPVQVGRSLRPARTPARRLPLRGGSPRPPHRTRPAGGGVRDRAPLRIHIVLHHLERRRDRVRVPRRGGSARRGLPCGVRRRRGRGDVPRHLVEEGGPVRLSRFALVGRRGRPLVLRPRHRSGAGIPHGRWTADSFGNHRAVVSVARPPRPAVWAAPSLAPSRPPPASRRVSGSSDARTGQRVMNVARGFDHTGVRGHRLRADERPRRVLRLLPPVRRLRSRRTIRSSPIPAPDSTAAADLAGVVRPATTGSTARGPARGLRGGGHARLLLPDAGHRDEGGDRSRSSRARRSSHSSSFRRIAPVRS